MNFKTLFIIYYVLLYSLLNIIVKYNIFVTVGLRFKLYVSISIFMNQPEFDKFCFVCLLYLLYNV